MQKPLKLYASKELFDQKLSYSPLLFPFWSPVIKEKKPFESALWKRYSFDPAYYCLVDEIRQADMVFLPHNYWLLKRCHPNWLKKSLAILANIGKPLLIDAYGDSDADLSVPNAYILRTSQYRFRVKVNEIILPAYVEDLKESYQEQMSIFPRQKTAQPRIGFTGWADVAPKTYAKMLLKRLIYRGLSSFGKPYDALTPGVMFRKKAIQVLKKTDGIRNNFIIRPSYSGNTRTMSGSVQELRRQFIANILQSDYVLTVKGNGNYSQRFYETLSLGRIPLLIDTECLLPLENFLDYKKFCLFVDYKEIDRIGDILSEFHRTLKDEEFLHMQNQARAAFENSLRIDRYTKFLFTELARKLQQLKR